jgi:hypothetical protein
VSEIGQVWCGSCQREHAAAVGVDGTGFPTTEWLQPHVGEIVRELVELAGHVLAQAVDVGDWLLAERAAALALELVDPEEPT